MLTPEEVADLLRGGCETFDFDDYGLEWCLEFDSILFRCEVCDWWCNIDEMSDESQICNDCVQSGEG